MKKSIYPLTYMYFLVLNFCCIQMCHIMTQILIEAKNNQSKYKFD